MLFGEAGTYDSLRAGILSDGQIGKLPYSFDYVHDETSNARPNNYLREDGFSLRLDAALSPTVTLGMTVRGQYGRYEEPSSDRALYLQDLWEVIPNLNLTAGGRYDLYEYAGNAFTYRFTGAYFFPLTSTKLRASYGTAFKAPDLFNTFSTSPTALGNPNLKPETSQGFDTGIDQSLWDGRFVLSSSFFHNYIRDVIAFVPSGPVTGSYANQNTGETYGIETELRANPFKSWQIRAAFTWTESYFTTAGVTQRNPYVPRYLFSFDTNYSIIRGLTIGIGSLFVGQREGEDFSYFPAKYVGMGDYWVLRAYARWEFNSHFAITFRGENLTDQHYQTTIGYPALGTALFCGAEIRF